LPKLVSALGYLLAGFGEAHVGIRTESHLARFSESIAKAPRLAAFLSDLEVQSAAIGVEAGFLQCFDTPNV